MTSPTAPAPRLTVLALVIFAAWTPLLPAIELNVAATLSATLLLGVSWFARVRAGETLGRTPLDVPAVIFLLVAALATLFSGTPAASALSATWQHGDGLLMSLAYTVMALAAARLSRRDASRLVATVLCGGVVMSVIAVAQFYGLDITAWSARMGTLPVLPAGTLGNKMFLAGYLSLVLPLCAGVAVDEAEYRWWMYAVAFAVVYAALVASQTRAAWVGSTVAGVVLVRYLSLSPVAAKRLAALGATAAAITIVMVVTRPDAGLVHRAISTFNPRDVSVHEHMLAWKQTLSLIAHSPVLGWGFSAPLDRFPGATALEAVRTSAGRPVIIDVTPNEVLHVAFVSGIAGLAAYLWVWGTLVTRLRASPRAAPHPHLRTALLASLVAYFVWLQFVWSRPGPAHVFWVLAGVAVAVTRSDVRPEHCPKLSPPRPGLRRPEREQAPLPGHTFQNVRATVVEFDPGTNHKVFDSARDQNFACAGQRGYPGADVDADPTNLAVVEHFDFSRMQPGPHLNAHPAHFVADGGSTPDGSGRTVESSQ